MAGGHAASHRGNLLARLALVTATRFGTLERQQANGIPRRPGDNLPGTRLAHRSLRTTAPPGSHAAALAAHDGSSAARMAQRTVFALAAWTPQGNPPLLDR